MKSPLDFDWDSLAVKKEELSRDDARVILEMDKNETYLCAKKYPYGLEVGYDHNRVMLRKDIYERHSEMTKFAVENLEKISDWGICGDQVRVLLGILKFAAKDSEDLRKVKDLIDKKIQKLLLNKQEYFRGITLDIFMRLGGVREAEYLTKLSRELKSGKIKRIDDRTMDKDHLKVFIGQIIRTMELMKLKAGNQQDKDEIDRHITEIKILRGDLDPTERWSSDLAYQQLNNALRYHGDLFLERPHSFSSIEVGDAGWEEDRLNVLERLKLQKSETLPDNDTEDVEHFLRKNYLEVRESESNRLTPTLGIEIEIRQLAVVPEAIKWSGDIDQNIYINKLIKDYEEITKYGIPYGKDDFWEFALRPAHYYLTLSREVEELVKRGLIPETYDRYPLHLTVGGISLAGPAGKESYVLARALEASAWGTDRERLTEPYVEPENASWFVRTKNNSQTGVIDRFNVIKGDYVQQREKDDDRKKVVELGETKVVEIVTMRFRNVADLNKLLNSAFYLGAALKSYQHVEELKVKGLETWPEMAELAAVWKRFSEQLTNIFIKNGLKRPDEKWNIEDQNEQEFRGLAVLLNEPNFVQEVQSLIKVTRKLVKNIIYLETKG